VVGRGLDYKRDMILRLFNTDMNSIIHKSNLVVVLLRAVILLVKRFSLFMSSGHRDLRYIRHCG
jgi:hypothetical protein